MSKKRNQIMPGKNDENSFPISGNSNVIEISTDDDEISVRDEANKSSREKSYYFIRENALLIATVGAVFLGVSFGFVMRAYYRFNPNEIDYLAFIGQLFLRMLKFLIMPLIASSLISGIAGLGSGNGGKIALRSLIYYFASTFVAVVIGIILVVIIKPGVGRSSGLDSSMTVPIDVSKKVTTHDTILDLIRF